MGALFHTSALATRSRKRLWLVLILVAAAISVAGFFAATLATSADAVEVTVTSASPSAAALAETTAPAVAATTEVTQPAGPEVDYSAVELEFVLLLNEYRVSEGLEPLLLSDTLTVACDRHSSDMATYDFVNHYTGYYRASSGADRPLKGTNSDYFATGTDPAERMIACGYDFATIMGENLAAGQETAAAALKALKASPTHDANLLCDDFKVIGISLVYNSDSDFGYYWTTDFGGEIDITAHAVATVVASVD